MKKRFGLVDEFVNNGFAGVIKRLFYYLPNHYIINKVEKSPVHYGLNRDKNRKEKIIVSLTSYPPRFPNICMCLRSLLCQTMKADRIIVWFGNDVVENMLTPQMKELQQYGIEYRYDSKENLKPHKKYYYAMQEYPDDIIITVDDDAVYPETLIETLMKSHSEHPKAVCARRVHYITTDNNGVIEPYKKWKKEYRREKAESHRLLAVGVGGVLYPPRCLHPSVFDINKLKQLCLNTDDIWLKCMELLNDTMVVWTPCFFSHPPALKISSSLWETNVNSDQNDVNISKTFHEYNVHIR